MSDLIKELSAPLGVEDVEFKIGTVKGGSGFSLLAYKTARADTKRLNEVFGLGWKNRYYYDDKGLLACEISIHVDSIGEWVARSDIGMPSFAEEEKGNHSDAFKRAGFKWGIGIELYNFPFVWVQWSEFYKNRKGNDVPKNFNSKDVLIDEYEVKDGKPVKLRLTYRGNVIFELGKKQTPKNQNKNIPQNLSEWTKQKGIDKKEFYAFSNVKNAEDAANLYADKGALSDMLTKFKETK